MELTQITICYFDDIGTLHAIMDVSPANHTVLLELGEEILTMTTLKLLKLHGIDLSEPRDLLQTHIGPAKGRLGMSARLKALHDIIHARDALYDQFNAPPKRTIADVT